MTDSELLEQIQEGKNAQQAFNELVNTYGQRLYWHIRKMVISHEDANDVLQNTLIKIWNGLPAFRGESSLFTWMYKVSTNEILTFLKKKKNFYSKTLEENKTTVLALESDDYFTGDHLQMLLQKAILTLPEKQRLVFNMRYFDEIKYEQMSEMLGTSTGALKASYHIASEKVEKYLKENS